MLRIISPSVRSTDLLLKFDVVFQLILEFRHDVKEYLLKMGSPKEDIIGDIDIGLSFIADQLMNRTESCCRYYLTCFLHFDTGKYRYTSPQYILY